MHELGQSLEHAGNTGFADNFAATISVPSANADRLAALIGRDDRAGRWLSEYEELYSILPYISYLNDRERQTDARVRFWLETFPELVECPPDYEIILHRLWDSVLQGSQVHAAVYGFGSQAPIDSGEFSLKAAELVSDAAGEWGSRQVAATGMSLFSMRFPPRGVPAQKIETLGGFESSVKRRMNLLEAEPGFVLRYLNRRADELHGLLSPRQFEEFACLLFREEGWEAALTPATRDGGKDVVATKEIDGEPVTVYVEAKLYGDGRSVGLAHVKEFVATLGGDGVDMGFMLTTSNFSEDARRWARERGHRIAVVEFLRSRYLAGRIAARMDDVPRSYRFIEGLLIK